MLGQGEYGLVYVEGAERVKFRPNKGTSSIINWIRIPFMLSWKCTALKVQGTTLEKIVIPFWVGETEEFKLWPSICCFE